MPEPNAVLRRPISMKRLLLLLPAAVLLAACGSAGTSTGAGGGTGPSASSSPAAVTTCQPPTGEMPAILVAADLDGDGTPESPYVLGVHDHVCPNHLVAHVDGRSVALDLGQVTLAPHATAIEVPGRTGDLIVAKQVNPRGGYQVHLYGYAGGALAEVTDRGRPVVPFIATDTPEGTPVSASCVPGGISVTEARTHMPVGVAAAYDVYRTTYRIDGNTATAGASVKVADNVLPHELAQKYPDLTENALFRNCTAVTTG